MLFYLELSWTQIVRLETGWEKGCKGMAIHPSESHWLLLRLFLRFRPWLMLENLRAISVSLGQKLQYAAIRGEYR